MTCTLSEAGTLNDIKYVVVLSFFHGHLLLSRHKERATWETQGGHIENGETPLEAARRELWEESGAVLFDLKPLCDYHAADDRGNANGRVYTAVIYKLGKMPAMEMAETRSFPDLPENLTYPALTPVFYQYFLSLPRVPENKRILLTLSYDGTAYAGWQYQLNAPSIQDTVEKALFSALGQQTRLTGASRTDAGVHALAQRAHFDTMSGIPPEKYPFVLNRYLPPDIRVTAARRVPDDFHARFNASGKEYTYRIWNDRQASAIYRNITHHVPVTLDESKMLSAGQLLLGTHDFAAFAAAGNTTKTTIRTIDRLHVVREGAMITVTVHGNAFLYNMVRIIAGTLIAIGQDKLPPECISRALDTGDRLCLGTTAPACGLELTQVEYDFEKQEAL